jgi:hypothetical protein
VTTADRVTDESSEARAADLACPRGYVAPFDLDALWSDDADLRTPFPPPAEPISGFDGQTEGRLRIPRQAGRAFEGVDRGHLVVLPR